MLFKSKNEDSFTLEVKLEIYSLDIIYKCFYWYLSDYTIQISTSKSKAKVTFTRKDGNAIDLDSLRSKITNDLSDYKVRQIIISETKNIRDLIIAKAFDSSGKYDFEPPGEVADPVGFEIPKKQDE